MSTDQSPNARGDARWVSGELCSVGCIPVDGEKVYRLRIDTAEGRETVYLSRAMQGLRLDVATGHPVTVGPLIECDLAAMEPAIAHRCERCGGTLRGWCAVDRFPQIRAVIDPDAQVAIAVPEAQLTATPVDATLRRPRQEVRICTACGHEQPVDRLRQMA